MVTRTDPSLLERLREKGVPEPMLERLESLVLEVEGYLVSDGWANPAGQARFVAKQLMDHAIKFYELREEV